MVQKIVKLRCKNILFLLTAFLIALKGPVCFYMGVPRGTISRKISPYQLTVLTPRLMPLGHKSATDERGILMSLHAHYEMVQEKHSKLEARICDESTRPYPDLAILQTLKKQKLLLKEELERIRHAELARMDAA